MPLSYCLGGVCFLCRDLRSSSFALMQMLVCGSREIVQLVLSLTVALMKSLCFAWGIRNSTYCLNQTRSASISMSYGFADSYRVRAWNCGTCGTSSPLLKH